AANLAAVSLITLGHDAILDRDGLVASGAQHVLHGVRAGRLAGQELRGVDGPPDEPIAIERAMAQFDRFALEAEDHGVLAGLVAEAGMSWARCGGSKPVVPTTSAIRSSAQSRASSSDAAGWEKSIIASSFPGNSSSVESGTPSGARPARTPASSPSRGWPGRS